MANPIHTGIDFKVKSFFSSFSESVKRHALPMLKISAPMLAIKQVVPVNVADFTFPAIVISPVNNPLDAW